VRVFIDANLLIYLNTISDYRNRLAYEAFYLDLLVNNKAYIDVLVLDELLWVSWRKYNVPYFVTLDFINKVVKPYVTILPLGEGEFEEAANLIKEYSIKPSDAFHIAVMKTHNISTIASEDREFDKIGGIKRVWLE
jgi:predicted nucleic acid-binding protein